MLDSRFRRFVEEISVLACVTMLACAGKSVRDADEDGDNAGEGGTRASGGNGGNGARGGIAGTSSGGTVSTSGASGTAAGGASGTAAGGASGATASGGNAGNSTGGASTGGSSGGDTCTPCTPTTCTTTILPTQVINDFDNLYFPEGNEPPVGLFGVLDETGLQKPEWWLGYFSGSYAYPMIPEACRGEPTPAYPLVRNEMGGVLRVTGTVGGPSGFGVWVGPCIVDLSAGSGIMFMIGGRAGSGALQMTINTSSTTDPNACQIGRGKCDTNICSPPSVGLDITESLEPFALPWTAFSPEVDPREVVQFRWDFEWVDGMNPYTVDVTLDNVMLIQ
jgi:hypothetical protein